MNKEQKETIAFIIIILAIIVAACVMLIIKPKMTEIADTKKSLKKVNADIEKQRKHSRQLIELSGKKEQYEKAIVTNEEGLFSGITVGDLSEVISTVSSSSFRDLKLNYLGDRAEVLPGKRYNELTNEIKILNCDYQKVARFIHAVENSNQGLRISNIAMDGASVKSEGDGTVTVGMEIRLLGLHEGAGIPKGWEPPETPAYDPGDQRNPFGAGGITKVDPEREFIERALNLKVTMNTADSIWIKDTSVPESGARECLINKLMPVFENVKVRLTSIHEDYFTVRREDGKIFKLMVRPANETIGGNLYERGTISKVIETE